MKFATKIFIYIFLSSTLIISGMFVVVDSWIYNHHIQTHIRFEKELAMLAALKSEDYIVHDERAELHRFYQSILKVNPYIDYIFIEKKKEVFVYTSHIGVPYGLLDLPALEAPYDVDITPIENNRGDITYHLRVGISLPPDTLLHLGVSHRKILKELRPLRMLMIGVGAFLLACFPIGLALFISHMVSRPLSTLSRVVNRIGTGELDLRIEMSTGDEIEQLVNDINTMAERLEKLKSGLEAEICQHKQTEHRLALQTELLDNILNHLPHNIFWKDKEYNFLGCNKAFAARVGIKNTEVIIGKNEYEILQKRNEADHCMSCDEKVVKTGLPMLDFEEAITGANGVKRSVMTSKVPLKDQTGQVYGLLVIFYDITERKQMEETLKHTQKMEAIGTLAGGIAHDFNNILGSIIGYTELAIDDLKGENETSSFLKQVLISALRAKDLVRQILTFSRKSREERIAVQLSSIVKEEAKLLRSTLPTTIEIRKLIDESTGLVNADPTQMHQIVMNLCTNAAHAMAERGGILSLELSSETITREYIKKYHNITPGPFMKLKISDTGGGIDSRIIHRIFEPFFTTKQKGTGMGLAVVHGIVRDHGGDIFVDSQPNRGTTFTVLLPEVFQSECEQERAVCHIAGGCERVLLVDDEKSLLNLGKKMLTSLGYDVTVKNASLDALETFRDSSEIFDVIISDQTMPHMTGYRLAEEVFKIRPSTRFILCTGYSDSITVEKINAAGIKALLYKPLRKKDLAKAVREVLDG